ncbi:MAG TPA: tetratricopeptide repeat protein [Thermoanaerobaculia bacterium]|jgi:tetratricopeptide (TPR) repeat protein
MKARAGGLVLLLIGGLLGFIGGYFAGGGGRPATAPAPGLGAASGTGLAGLHAELERDPRNPALLAAVGNWHYDRQEWEDAIEYYDKSLRRKDDASVRSDLGAAYRNLGEFERAIAEFERARKANPEHWQALLNLVLVQAFDQRDGAAAAASFRELKQKYPDIPNLDHIEKQISGLSPRT